MLILSASLPYPPTDGVKIKTFNLIKALSIDNELYLISFYDTKDEIRDEYLRELNKYCKILGLIKKRDLNLAYIVFNNLFGEEFGFLKRYKCRIFINTLKNIISKEKFDVIFFDTINLGQYHIYVPNNIIKIISPNDSLSLALYDSFKRRKIYDLVKLYDYIMYIRTKKYEKRIYQEFDACHVLSEVDRRYLKSINSNIEVYRTLTAVDIDFFKPLSLSEDYPSILYLGTLSGGGADYIVDFINNVYKKLINFNPNIKFYIVGKNPKVDLLKISKKYPNIVLTGYVPDVRGYIAKSTLCISPVRKRVGILNKVLQAMAMAKVVIGTPESFMGIKGAVDGINCIIAKDYKDFVHKILNLLDDSKSRKKIGYNARKLVEKMYSITNFRENINNLLNKVISEVDIKNERL